MISTVLPSKNITTVSSDNNKIKLEEEEIEKVKTEKIITPNLANVVSFPEFFQTCRNNNKNDVNLNILNSELVTFRTNFYRHIPRKNFKNIIMSNSTNNSVSPTTSTITTTVTDCLSNNYLSQSQIKNNIGFTTMITSSIPTIATMATTTTTSSSSSLSTIATQKPKHSEVLRGKDSYVWDMWMRTPNTTPASTVLNSPDLTEIEIKNQYHHHHHHHHQNQHQHQQHHQIKVGRSPVGHNDSHNSCSPTSPSSSANLAVVADGEIVVFDDIEDNWHRSNIISSPVLSEDEQQHHYKFQEEFDNYRYGHNYSDIKDTEQAAGNTKITKMIGALPIAEYEGSPRRFGNIHHHDTPTLQQHKYQNSRNLLTSPSFYSPRPGFPKRVILSPSDNSIIIDKSDNYDEACRQNDIIDTATTTTPLQLSQPTTPPVIDNKEQTFDYLYEFSETRKVLEEFFKCPNDDDDDDKKIIINNDLNESDIGNYNIDNIQEHLYIGQRLAKIPTINNDDEFNTLESPQQRPIGHYNIIQGDCYDNNEIELYLDSGSRSSGELADTEMEHNTRRHSRNFTLSPETTDYDSNCGDLDSLSNDVNGGVPDFVRLYTSMPVLEDGLSSGHASDTENNNPISIVIDRNLKLISNNKLIDNIESPLKQQSTASSSIILPGMAQRTHEQIMTTTNNMLNEQLLVKNNIENNFSDLEQNKDINKLIKTNDLEETLFSRDLPETTPRSNNLLQHEITPAISNTVTTTNITTNNDVQAALIDIRNTLQRTKALPINQHDKLNLTEVIESSNSTSPIWIPRREDSHESLDSDNPSKIISIDDEEADTDLETDRLLGQQRLDDQGFYDEKNWCERKLRNTIKSPSTSNTPQTIINNFPSAAIRQAINSNILPSPADIAICNTASTDINDEKNCITPNCIPKSPTDSIKSKKENEKKGKTRNKEGRLHDPAVLIEGVLFRARYLGSTQLVCEGQPTKTTRMMQAEEAVSRIKAPEGETQPSTEVDLFISTEKIMVLNTDLKEIMMDHALRTISYIADIGDLVVLMARRRFVPQENDEGPKPNRTPKMICHVFESEEAQFIAQSIGQAFQVAYMEFLKANGIEDHSFVKEMDYQEVLNSQEIFGDELEIFAKKELQKEVVVPKAKGEILGVVIVESGWGSMLPTVVIANLLSSGAAARCGQLNIGDQIIAINGLSLVGLPLSTCQNYIRNTKNQTAVKFTVVPCPPVVEVKIKRPNTKYQLGFSVQNGVICSLLRGGIAERGGVRVGHRIIEINNQSVVAVPHEKIVNLLATSVGEILMKTMPTSMFRLLTGQENPVYI